MKPSYRTSRLAVTVARRFTRSPRLRASALVTLVATMVVTVAYVLLQSQSLTGQQRADRDLGKFNAYAGFGVTSFEPGQDPRSVFLSRVAPVVGTTVQVGLNAPDFTASAISSSSVTLSEMEWSDQPFPKKYELLEGRWPAKPGEVAVLNPPNGSDDVPGEIAAYGGRVRLNVVGTVDDRYSRPPALLAGAGTWAGLNSGLADSNPTLRAQPTVYWDGERRDAVLTAITDGYRQLMGDRAPAQIAEIVRDTYADRQSVSAREATSWVAQSPAGYSLPSLLLPFLAALTVFSINSRRLTPALTTMVSLGMTRQAAVGGVGLAVAFWNVAAVLAGGLSGFAVGLLAAKLLSEVIGTPTPAVPDAVSPLARSLLVSLLGCVAGMGLLWAATRDQRTLPPATYRRMSRRARGARRSLALAVFAAAAIALGGVDSAAAAMIFSAILTIGIVLVLPDLVPAMLRRLPERSLRSRLTKRQLLADARRASLLVGVLSVLVSLSTGFVALLDTMIRTAGAQVYPEVLPGQVKIADRSTDVLPPYRAAMAVARTVPAIRDQRPLQMRFLIDVDNNGDAQAQAMAGNYAGLILVVDSSDDVELLIGRPIDADQADILNKSGILIWAEPFDSQSVDVTLRRGEGAPQWIAHLRATAARIDPAEWNIGTTGVTLTATAKRYRLPVANGGVLFTDVPNDAAMAVQTALEQSGMDPRFAKIYRTPPPPIPPVALYVTAVGVVAIALLVTLALTRAQVRALRDYLGHLIALGISIKWARQIVVRQHLLLLALATALGLLSGLSAAVAAASIPGFYLSVPWDQLMVLVVAIFCAVTIAALLASRKLAPRERRL